MKILLSFVFLLALAFVYVGQIRPYFERKGWVRSLPVFAQTFRERLCVHIRSSVTIGWGYLLQIGGASVELALQIDRDQVSETLRAIGLGEWVGLALVIIGWITVIARMRTARA